jgi:hypothetical protein
LLRACAIRTVGSRIVGQEAVTAVRLLVVVLGLRAQAIRPAWLLVVVLRLGA